MNFNKNNKIHLLLILLYLVSPTCILCQNFVDSTDIAGVRGAGIGNGVAFVDYDNDGDLDLYVSSDPNDILYRNNGDGTFEDVTAAAGISVAGDGVAAAFGDYDNDGDPDLYIAVNDGPDIFYQNEGGKVFRDVTNEVRINNPGRARSASFADFDNDGFLDIYVVNEDSPNILYKNVTGKFFEDVAQVMGVADSGPGRCGIWGDYDNDGDLDLYLTNKGASNILYRNDRSGFKDVTKSAGVEGSGDSTGAAFADYDNDGCLDICLGGNRRSFLYHNNGDGIFTNVADQVGVTYKGSGCTPNFGDYDNDGYLDIYLAVWKGKAVMYHNNGDGTFKDVTEESGMEASGNGWGAASGDYNNDGCLDIYASYTTRSNILYQNAGGDNNWLHIKTRGSLSNRDGIGAQIRLTAGGLSQIREVCGGSGYGSQDSFAVEFGLGKNTKADFVEIKWPSGIIAKWTDVKANQTVIAEENPWCVESPYDKYKVPGLNDRIPDISCLLPNYPNPFNPETWIPYQLAEQSYVWIYIYNSDGRMIRRLDLGYKKAGSYASKNQAALWDGRNDAGELAANGVYFYQLRAGNFMQVRKMVLKK